MCLIVSLFKLTNVKINECFCFNLKKDKKILVYIKQKMLFVYAILKDKQNINFIYLFSTWNLKPESFYIHFDELASRATWFIIYYFLTIQK